MQILIFFGLVTFTGFLISTGFLYGKYQKQVSISKNYYAALQYHRKDSNRLTQELHDCRRLLKDKEIKLKKIEELL